MTVHVNAGAGSSGATAFGAPEVTYFVNVLNTATSVVAADSLRMLIQFWNQSAVEIDLFPAASGIIYGQAIPLPPKASSGPNRPLEFYTTCAWQAIHNSTGSQGLLVVCWSS